MAVHVSIVIPVFNRVEYTEACLRALAAHTPADVGFELVIVDNASSDGTPALLAQLEGAVVVHRNETNLGFAKACNQGARLASGEILVFLNNDTEVHAGWLRPLLDELDEQPKTGAVGSRLLYPDGTVQHAGVAIGRDQIPYHIHSGLAANDPKVTERRAFPIVTAACIAVRRQEFFDLGAFDEGFINGHEDIDLCMRLRQADREVIYRPDSVVTHYESVSEGRMDKRPHNVARTFAKWREQLVQDDFRFRFPESERAEVDAPLRFAIKIGTPDRTLENWGDIYFAECLAKSLCRAGHSCEIHYLSEWGGADRNIDVAIHIKGLSEYVLKPHAVNVMWMINHPDLHRDDELERYDAVFVASQPHADLLAKRLSVPVVYLPQATDPEHFSPSAEPKRWDLVFVGNNRGKGRSEMRRIIRDLLPTRHSLAVWGDGWQGKLPDGVWQGTFVSWAKLPKVYQQARVVLNDHHDDMQKRGFINNRTFDALACGAAVMSDPVPGLEALDHVSTYQTREELAAGVRALVNEPRPASLPAGNSFDDRARSMLTTVLSLDGAWQRVREQPVIEVRGHPKVSVLMATYDRRQFLPAAIKSIVTQRYPNWELVLVNDGGPSVADLVDAIADSRVHLVELAENRGKGHAINTAFDASDGDFIAYLDDDDIWYSDHLERVLLPLTNLPGVDFAYSDALNVTLEADGDGAYREVSRELLYRRQTGIDELLMQNQIQGMSAVHRRDLYKRAGRFDEELPVLIDWDMWRRLASLCTPYHVSAVTAEHYLRRGAETSGAGQLTNMAGAKRLRWIDARLRVLQKPVPGGQTSEWLQGEVDLSRYWRLVYEGEDRADAGDSKGALELWRRARKRLPEQLGAPRRIALHNLKAGRLAEAFKRFAECIQLGSTDVSDFLYAALAGLKLGKPRETLKLLSRLNNQAIALDERPQAMLSEYVRRAHSMLQATNRRVS
ncbi:MAG: glycosyltransferase [Myxococcota bacterium]